MKAAVVYPDGNTFYSGLSGLQLPIPKYLHPPPYEQASRLTFYASLFNSIEINSSFYKIPQRRTVERWAASVPDTFRFTFKLWKGITHVKGLEFHEADVVSFFTSINAVKEKKGCLLLQFPPSFNKAYIGPMEHLLGCIQRHNTSNEWNVAIEFRHTSWYDDEVFKVLHHYNATLVVHDIPKFATPLMPHPLNFIYLRFHGPTGNYRESYQEDFLNEYATYIHEWRTEGKTVYVYFNNTMGDAFNNLKTLNRSVDDLTILIPTQCHTKVKHNGNTFTPTKKNLKKKA